MGFSNPNHIPTPPSSNLQCPSSWQADEVGNIYEEIRPLKKTSRSDQVTKETSGEESARTDDHNLVLNISPRRSNRQHLCRFTDWDLAVDLRDPVEAFQPVPQMNSL